MRDPRCVVSEPKVGATVDVQESTLVPWTDRVLSLLERWHNRAAISQEAHYALATKYTRYNVWFGIPVVALATLVGTSVFATLQKDVQSSLRILVGFVSVLAAVLASLQTFLRFQERAEKHRASAEEWAAIRRQVDQIMALHPEYLAGRTDPGEYIDRLRERIDRISAQSLEIGASEWDAARQRLGLKEEQPAALGHATAPRAESSV